MKTFKVTSLIIIAVGLLSWSFSPVDFDYRKINPHGDARGGGGSLLPFSSNSLFTGSGICRACHGLDGEGVASVDSEGNDVNVVDDWRASMMANSAKDPFWQAKVSHEVAINPQHQEVTETVCTKCHAPMGRFAAFHDGAESYSLDEMRMDELALDGVSCVICHQQKKDGIGTVFSGDLNFEEELIAYGQYENPFAEPMVNFSLYEPVYSEHVQESEMCATCHTLITSTINLEGEFTGESFVEQATYHEWLNSDYNSENVECQACHMPSIDDPIRLSIGYITQYRSPYSLHTFTGANAFMLRLMRDNIEELGLSASSDDFTEAISRTINMLGQQTLEVNLEAMERVNDTAYFRLEMLNLAGHKFPSGYPARRAFVKFTLTDDDGNELFVSGDWDDENALIERDEPYEPHYDVINSEDQVQIYEMAFADVEGNLSTVLERAHQTIKDNRFPPQGFTTTHVTYDTTAIVGLALEDENFNKIDGIEGSGMDILEFRIPLNGYQGMVNASARVYYQTAPPEWMEEMFAETTEEILSFKEMYDDNNQNPYLISSSSAFFEATTSVGSLEVPEISAFIYDHVLNLSSVNTMNLDVYSVSGSLIYSESQLLEINQINTSDWPDIVIIRITDSNGRQSYVNTLFNQ